MMGGKEAFDHKLNRLFTENFGKSKWQYYATLPDATGNVGQFVMGNEPSMHIAYLYNLAGKPTENTETGKNAYGHLVQGRPDGSSRR